MSCLDRRGWLDHTSAKSPVWRAFRRISTGSVDRGSALVEPQSKSSRSGKRLSVFDWTSARASSSIPAGGLFSSDSLSPDNLSPDLLAAQLLSGEPADARSSSNPGSGKLDGSTALSLLKNLIVAGDHRLDPILGTITDAARQLTGASGAALAMWKEGEMVCRARSGETAPVLGARLSAEGGISGECLRNGKVHHCRDTENDPVVDVEVCRSLGLRSIAALPIQGWRGINGILEVFSTRPGAFSEQHIALLQQLAALAERARSSQPHGASSSVPKAVVESAQTSGLLPASDRVGDVALAFLGSRSRPLVLGAISVVAVSLLALMIWLGWRGPVESEGKADAATRTTIVTPVTTATATSSGIQDNDPIWKPDPGGEALRPSDGKTQNQNAAGAPVKLAAEKEILARMKTRPERSALLSDIAANMAVPRDATSLELRARREEKRDAKTDGAGSSASVLPQSQAVTGGEIVRRVPPVYPGDARLLRLEGTVVLAATIMEDGSVGDVRLIEGSSVLAQSAVDAVKEWRYRPFEQDGKAVKNEVRISLDFKLPSDVDSR